MSLRTLDGHVNWYNVASWLFVVCLFMVAALMISMWIVTGHL